MDPSALAIALSNRLLELERWSRLLDSWLNRWTAMVAIGVVLEVVFVVWEYRIELFEFRRGTIRSPEKPKLLKYVIELLGVGLVAAGVTGELVIHTRSGRIDTEIRDITREQVSIANTRASDADLKRVELQSKILETFGPRILSETQVGRIATKLSSLRGTKVDVVTFSVGNPWSKSEADESANLARAIVHALASAGLDIAGWIPKDCEEAIGASNVMVNTTDVNKPSRDKDAALRIFEALSPEVPTFPVISEFDVLLCEKWQDLELRPKHGKPTANINIVVGRKVPPMLTPEVLGVSQSVAPPQR